MENGVGIQNSDVATLSLLGRGGYGWGGYHDPANFRGDGSAVKEGVRANRDISLLESVNNGTREQFLSSQIRQHNDSMMDAINTGNQFITDRISAQSLNDRFAGIERILFSQGTDAQRDRTDTLLAIQDVKCCCEKNGAKIDSLAALNAKDLEITKLQLQLSASQNAGGPPGQGN